MSWKPKDSFVRAVRCEDCHGPIYGDDEYRCEECVRASLDRELLEEYDNEE
jgi:hypothetical protein